MEDVLWKSQKIARSTRSYFQYWGTLWTNTVGSFTGTALQGSCNDKERQTLQSMARALPRFVSHVLNTFILLAVRSAQSHAKGFLLKSGKTPYNILRLQYLGTLACLRWYTDQTAGITASDDILPEASAQQYCWSRLARVNTHLEDFNVCVSRLLRELL